jgi:hypothetical protein
MRRHGLLERLPAAVVRVLGIAAAAVVLGCGSLLILLGTAGPAAAGCGDQVTYQSGMPAENCPRRQTAVTLTTVDLVVLGATGTPLALAIIRSAASSGDLAALDEALAAEAGVPSEALGEAEALAEEEEELAQAGEGRNEPLTDAVMEGSEYGASLGEGAKATGKREEGLPPPVQTAGQPVVAQPWHPYEIAVPAEDGLVDPVRGVFLGGLATAVVIKKAISKAIELHLGRGGG